jgi:hypothetical protein
MQREPTPVRVLGRVLVALVVPWPLRLYALRNVAQRRRDKVVIAGVGIIAAIMFGSARGIDAAFYMVGGLGLVVACMLATDLVLARGERRQHAMRAARRASATERITASNR